MNRVTIGFELQDALKDKLFRFRAFRKRSNRSGKWLPKVEYPIYILTMPDYRVIVKFLYSDRIDIVITETYSNRVLCADTLMITTPNLTPASTVLDGIRSIYIDVIYHGFRRHKFDGFQKCEDTSLGRVIA